MKKVVRLEETIRYLESELKFTGEKYKDLREYVNKWNPKLLKSFDDKRLAEILFGKANENGKDKFGYTCF